MPTTILRNALAYTVLFFTLQSHAVDAVPGEFVVQLKTSRSVSAQRASQILNAQVLEMIRPNVALIRANLLRSTESVVQELGANPNVQVAEPNFIYRSQSTPNDADYSKLWGIANSGQADDKGNLGTAGIDVNAEKAWAITTGSRNVIVAVIDSGVDFTHEDLKNNAWVNEAEAAGKAGVDDDGNGYIDDINGYDFVNLSGNLIDDNGHGTHCAGTIGAEANNGIGVVGVAHNVRLMGVKFLNAMGSGSLADAVKAIDYARNAGAHIMSNSWGGGSYSLILEKAIKDANDAGILFTAAAGNSMNNNDKWPAYPATYKVDNIVSVAALNNVGSLASFSSYGATSVHVAAPGVGVYSTYKGSYKYLSGTSMATPHVSGVAALVLASKYCGDDKCEKFSPKDVRDLLVKTSRPLSNLKTSVLSGGIVDAYAALAAE